MKTEHALRNLLLLRLKRFEQCIPRALFLEVTQTLTVVVRGSDYVVTWRAAGEPRGRTFTRDAFTFYRRGDTAPPTGRQGEDGSAQNQALADAFAQEVFGGVAPTETDAGEGLEPFRAYGVVESGVFGVIMGTVGGLGLGNGTLLSLLCLSEHATLGRLYSSALFIPLGLLGCPTATALGALAYGLLQFLDPDPTYRRMRCALCATAVVVAAGSWVTQGDAVQLDSGALLLALVALACAVARSLYRIHVRTLPLALPFYVLGVYVDGHLRAALFGFAFTILSALVAAYGHHRIPIQREPTLAANP